MRQRTAHSRDRIIHSTERPPRRRELVCAHPSAHTPGTRMEIRTWRSAIAGLKGSPPGAPSGALGEGTPGWVWRCDAAISRYHSQTCLLCVFGVQPKHPNGAIFVNTDGFRPCLSNPSCGAPRWALKARLMQKERLKSPHKPMAGMPHFLTPAAKNHSAAPFCAIETNQVLRL